MSDTPTSTPLPSTPVRTFISYAWEDEDYRKEIRAFATALRADGVNVRLDYWHLEGLTIPEFMSREVRLADKVLICASPKYKRNVQLMEDGQPTGTGWEAMLVTSAIWSTQKRRTQFEVVLFRGTAEESFPLFLSGWPSIDLTLDYKRNYSDLLRRLTGNREAAPPIGRVPEFPFEKIGAEPARWRTTAGARQLSRPGVGRPLLDRRCPGLHDWLRRMGWLNTPAEYPVLRDHLLSLQAYLKQEIEQRTYIENIAKMVPRSGLGDEALAGGDPFALPIQRVIRSILGQSQGGDSASAQLAAVNRRSRVVHDLLKTLRRSQDPLILLGDPGTGKTLTLQQAALAATRDELLRTYPSIPIYVRAGEFHVAEGEVTVADVLDYVKRSVGEALRPLVSALDLDGRLIIFFDGLDEMSRDRYSEHTTALSQFAGRHYYAGSAGAKTLFSCRITDFSPTFRHARLVLLPFSEPQIREYLERSFPGQEFLDIEQRRWSFRELARHLDSTDFSIDASNPFVLYLLCFYLYQKQSWPGSRTELLRFFLEETYRRKEQEQEEDLPFPPHEQACRDWAAVAFLITSRNLGGAISVNDIAVLPGFNLERAQQVIRLGRRCGILAESIDRSAHLVRLDHHRLQEYLTASHIYAENPPLDWVDKIDAPRWQETLVNLVVMGGGDEAIDVLSASISEPITAKRLEWAEYEHAKEAAAATEKDRIPHPPPMEHAAETVLADRIEVAARIARDGTRRAPVTGKLLPAVRDAVDWLTLRGNPITQVKMIRVVMQVPEPGMIEAARRPLKSGVAWLRNQALILLSLTGADLPTEIAEDVAEGQLLSRIPSYVKALKNTRQRGARYCFVVGILCSVAEWMTHLAIAIGLYVLVLWLIAGQGFVVRHQSTVPKMLERIPHISDLAWSKQFHVVAPGWAQHLARAMLTDRWLGVGIAVVLLAGILTARKKPESFGRYTLLAAGISLFIPFWLIGAWYDPGIIVYPLYVLFGVFLPIVLFGVLDGTLRCAFLTAYTSATFRCYRVGGTYQRVARRAWMAGSAFAEWNTFWWVPLLLVAATILWLMGFWGVALLATAGALAGLAMAASFLMSALGMWRLIPTVPTVIRAFFRKWTQRETWRATLPGLGGLAIVVAFIILANEFGELMARIVVTILGAALVVGLCWQLVLLMKWIRYLTSSPYPPGSFTTEEWLRVIKASNAGAQGEILIRTTHESLSLTPAAFLEVLQSAGGAVKVEPALSTYWRRRAELEQVLRQERRG